MEVASPMLQLAACAGDARAAAVLLQPVELAVPPLDHPRPVQAGDGEAEDVEAAVERAQPPPTEQLGGSPRLAGVGVYRGVIYLQIMIVDNSQRFLSVHNSQKKVSDPAA